MSRVKDRTEEKYGRLTPTRYFFKKNNKGKNIVWWICDCDCGMKNIEVRGFDLGRSVNSCGCIRTEENRKKAKNNITHGMTKSKFYMIWKSMVSRCKCETHTSYQLYGEKGINVDDEWLKFEIFYEDMYDSYIKHIEQFGEEDTSIDRIEVEKGYYKGNCKWETWHNQSRNRRNNKTFIAKNDNYGEFYDSVAKDFAEKFNLDASCILKCLKGKRKSHKGWTFSYLEGR